MTKTRKRLLALIIIFTMLISYFIPISSVEAEGVNKPDGAEWLVDAGENHVWYKLTENTPITDPVSYTLTIGGSGAMKDWKSSDTGANSHTTAPWHDKTITTIIFNEGVTKIGEYSFVSSESLESVKLAESVKSIGHGAFRYCTNLNTIEFKKGLEYIGAGAFNSCGFTSLTFPEGLTKIDGMAFQHNYNLTKIVLPSTLTEIAMSAFSMFDSKNPKPNVLKEIVSYNSFAPTLGNNSFQNVEITTLTIPYGSIDSYKTNWDSYKTSWDIDETNPNLNYLYKITVTSNDENMGTASASEKLALKDTTINLIQEANTGYQFVEWEPLDVDVNIDATTGQFTMPDCNVKIKAIFDKKHINVTYNLNGGSGIEEEEITYGNKINKPADPTKTGYTFDGWYEDEELNNVFNFDATITNDITLYAKWKANEYEVTFDVNEGTVIPENKNVTFNSTYGDLPLPTRDGYTFDGWFTAKENGTEIKSDTIVSITEKQTLYAKWIKNTYTVTFKDGEDELLKISNITSGRKVAKPEGNFPKEGYDFKGWYADATLTTEFDFNAPITKDTYVYAKYEKTQENPPMPPADELKDIELDVIFNDFSGFVRINDKMNDGVFEADSYKGTYIKVGYTTPDKTNKIYVIPSVGEPRVKDVTINGTKYSRGDEGVEVSLEDGLIVTIAGAEKYTIIANPDKDAPTTRTIIWANSDFNEDAKPDDYNEDAVLKNGKARVIAIYDEDGNKISGEQEVDENGLGFITAIKNQKVVFEFTPNYGYQLTKILANGFELEPQDTLNQYVFTMPDTNVHFTATFTKVEDIVKADSKKVSSGEIVLANNELDAGTARLSVKDIELSNDKIEEFKNAAGEYEIKSYIDIDLDQIFYKGSNDESNVWEKKIDTLSNKATITLKLADGITADDIVIVHNIHDGDNYEIIEIENYDPETNTITFKTNSFSNYAIATKTSSNTNNDTPTNTNDNPKTGDNIYVYISLMAFAMVGIIITSKSLKKSK